VGQARRWGAAKAASETDTINKNDIKRIFRI
jgi:hypothetical protein